MLQTVCAWVRMFIEPGALALAWHGGREWGVPPRIRLCSTSLPSVQNGHFDAHGNYTPHAREFMFKDAWLESLPTDMESVNVSSGEPSGCTLRSIAVHCNPVRGRR